VAVLLPAEGSILIDGTNVPWLNGNGDQHNVPAMRSGAAHSGNLPAVASSVTPVN
jgi:hypothetical protein